MNGARDVVINLDPELEARLLAGAGEDTSVEDYIITLLDAEAPGRPRAEETAPRDVAPPTPVAERAGAGLDALDLCARATEIIEEFLKRRDVQERIKMIAPYASFEKWLNFEIYFQLRKELENAGRTARPESKFPYEGKWAWADIAVGPNNEDFAADCHVEGKQIWRKNKQIPLARSDAERTHATKGGLLLLTVGSRTKDGRGCLEDAVKADLPDFVEWLNPPIFVEAPGWWISLHVCRVKQRENQVCAGREACE